MSTTEITRIEDVRVGDAVTMGRDGVTVSGTLESSGTSLRPLANWHMHFVGVGTLYGRDGWTLISATREMPEWETGMAGTATVRGVKGVRVMRTSGTGGADLIWLSASMVSGVRGHEGCQVTDFVPDDASRWAAQAKLVELDLDNARAEVERLRAARTLPTREQVALALWPHAPEGARDGLAHTDMVDRVMVVIEQGGAS